MGCVVSRCLWSQSEVGQILKLVSFPSLVFNQNPVSFSGQNIFTFSGIHSQLCKLLESHCQALIARLPASKLQHDMKMMIYASKQKKQLLTYLWVKHKVFIILV